LGVNADSHYVLIVNVLYIRKELCIICHRFRQAGMYHMRLEMIYLNYFLYYLITQIYQQYQ